MDKVWAGTILIDAKKEGDRPKLTIPQQIKYMREKKGIQFHIVDEEHALSFLETNNYYFKLKAFEKNYPVYTHDPQKKGQYEGLEFAYLKELSTLDMYLRKLILDMTLDIEHYMKVQLLRDISANSEEDGYTVVQKFFKWHPTVKTSIQEKSANSYCEDLINKYSDNFAAWNIVEVLSFGDLINLCDTYYSSFPNSKISIGTFQIVKFLRNAAAHNNCLINNLSDNSGNGFTQNREANSFVATIKGISTKTRNKKMGNRTVHDFVVMLYCFNNIVSSNGVRTGQILKLQKLINGRFRKNSEYFASNALLCSNYEFIKKVVDKFAESCI
mgnify:CR=1 FL=1